MYRYTYIKSDIYRYTCLNIDVSARKILKKSCLFIQNHFFLVRGSGEEEKCCYWTVLITSFNWNVIKILLNSNILYLIFAYTWSDAHSFTL